ncbi:hypothetical protein CY35_01G048000 [Sphagnum magellanicum]|nr:hypothetical protein CY35_01G048000 [Sphagnum magellanicum]
MATRYAAVSQDEPQTKKNQTRSGDQQQQQQRVEKEEVMQGGGKLSMSAIAESVDRLLDESHRYKSAVQAAFVRFQLPPPSPASPPHLPIDSLLSALQYFIERIMEKLDAKAGKLVLRTVTQDDINTVVRADPALSLDHQTLDYEQFERFARETLKHVALDRGKRLGLFMIGGMLVVHMTKNAVKKIPLLGAPLGAFINVMVPTTLVGPAVGVAGAMYL